MLRIFSLVMASTLAMFANALPSLARDADVYTSFLSSLAVGGYDTVAYFRENRPVMGRAEFTFDYKGAKWQFSSKANLDAFRANPTAFAPQYGGYCAWAVAHNYTASGDPLVWKIVNGRLFLNYDRKVQTDWETNIPKFIADGDKNWPGVLGK